MKFETSFDDASKHDERLVYLLTKYNIPAVLYVPIQCELGMFRVKELSQLPNIEIGCHTVSHPMDMKLLTDQELEYEVKSAKEMIEVATDKPCTKFCYPRGRYDERVRQMVISAGFESARTTKVLATKLDDNVFETPTTIHVYNRKEYDGKDWYSIAIEMFEKAKEEDGYFHLWGHSAEIEKYDYWFELEKFFEYVSKKI